MTHEQVLKSQYASHFQKFCRDREHMTHTEFESHVREADRLHRAIVREMNARILNLMTNNNGENKIDIFPN